MASSFALSIHGESAMPPANSAANTGAVSGVADRAHDQRGERERRVEPHQRRERRGRDHRRRGGLQDHRDVETGQAVRHPERDQRRPDQQRRAEHHPRRRGGNQRGPREMPAHFDRIDAQEGEAEQREQRIGEDRLQQRGERRQHHADEQRGRDRARALPAEPGERGGASIYSGVQLNRFLMEQSGVIATGDIGNVG
jgi:hypothetical protein